MSDQPLSAGTEIRAAIEAGEAAATPTEIVVTDETDSQRSVFVATVPYGGDQVTFDPERFEAYPRRRTGVVRPQTVQSLVDYTLRHREELTTTIWIDMADHTITSVLDDHALIEGEAAPGWGEHRAVLKLETTPEWDHWFGQDGKLMSQVEFAEHVEDGVREIITPTAADMLEIAQTFQSHTDAQFRTATRLASGQVNFRYDEETTAKAGTNGDLEVPATFTLGISPFLGEDPYQVMARLRYRASGGTLRIGYRLDRPDAVLRDALQHIADRIRSEHDAVFVGAPRR